MGGARHHGEARPKKYRIEHTNTKPSRHSPEPRSNSGPAFKTDWSPAAAPRERQNRLCR